jgi:hypothetical protein
MLSALLRCGLVLTSSLLHAPLALDPQLRVPFLRVAVTQRQSLVRLTHVGLVRVQALISALVGIKKEWCLRCYLKERACSPKALNASISASDATPF